MPGSYAPPGMRVITLNRLAVLIIAITAARVPYARAVRTASDVMEKPAARSL
ncbi:hypothetical protein [Streptomyces sp. BBFR109]|uniref:hypothetical protein n=1 Tax=Streptomyces sp. BBFR109 TaxID=3448172 RepID=UPI003F76BE54